MSSVDGLGDDDERVDTPRSSIQFSTTDDDNDVVTTEEEVVVRNEDANFRCEICGGEHTNDDNDGEKGSCNGGGDDSMDSLGDVDDDNPADDSLHDNDNAIVHTCPDCPLLRFTHRHQLAAHRGKWHPTQFKRYTCKVCGYSLYNRRYELVRHMLSVHDVLKAEDPPSKQDFFMTIVITPNPERKLLPRCAKNPNRAILRERKEEEMVKQTTELKDPLDLSISNKI